MAVSINLDASVGVTKAARILSMREDTLKNLANTGGITCTRQMNETTGNADRLFKIADLLRYRQARLARLTQQLAQAENRARSGT